jgi:hypothetical protein
VRRWIECQSSTGSDGLNEVEEERKEVVEKEREEKHQTPNQKEATRQISMLLSLRTAHHSIAKAVCT